MGQMDLAEAGCAEAEWAEDAWAEAEWAGTAGWAEQEGSVLLLRGAEDGWAASRDVTEAE